MNKRKIITSEYVSYGHPDKVADQISDAILDEYVMLDSNARVGIETMIKDNVVVLGGEVKTNAEINIEQVVRDVIEDIGYPDSHKLHGEDIKIINLIGEQSKEISSGVDRDDCECIGAGDQGFAVGMAINETKEYMPLGVYIARQICNAVTYKEGFGPDVKTQVSVEYGARMPRVRTIVVSSMHKEEYDIKYVRKVIREIIETNRVDRIKVMDDEIFQNYIKGKDIEYLININGEWNIGGPISDCGITGRKIVVDQYGGYCNVGGGAFSGKDMSKIDRSAAYMCRYIAKNIIDAGLAQAAKVELSYVISEPQPCSIIIELNHSIFCPDVNLEKYIENYVRENIDLTPKGIIDRFFPHHIEPIFLNCARNGHFGFNNNDFYPWEKTDFSERLREYIEIVKCKFEED